jgi:hypothetical protein
LNLYDEGVVTQLERRLRTGALVERPEHAGQRPALRPKQTPITDDGEVEQNEDATNSGNVTMTDQQNEMGFNRAQAEAALS